MPTIAEALALAVQYQQAGDLSAAENIYRQILAQQPDHPEALHLLGVLAQQTGHSTAAIELIQRALAVYPDMVAAYLNLGVIFNSQGRFDETILVGRRALEIDPQASHAYVIMSEAWKRKGDLDAAIISLRQALAIAPDNTNVLFQLGLVCRDRGRVEDAAQAYRQIIAIQPDNAAAHNNLGNMLHDLEQTEAAIAVYRRALEIKPDYSDVYNNLGNSFLSQGKLNEAIESYRRAIAIEPTYAEAYNNLGNILKDRGDLKEAISCYHRATELMPNLWVAWSNLLYTLYFSSDFSAADIFKEHRRWNEQQAVPLAAEVLAHDNDRTPNRRLRIGYVSPDFRLHPVGRFMLPLLETHTPEEFDIYCYSSVLIPDALTAQLQAQANVWRDTRGISDENLAQLVRQDRIDILVDLSMHMSANRLLAFARKPAPVQVTYLAYAGTTGLDTIDYRLTDPYLDPPGQDDQWYSEKSVRLPETYWCYRPGCETPPVNDLPAAATGRVTFASLNNFGKVSEAALDTWGRVLQSVPDSRLIIHAHGGSHRDRVLAMMHKRNISAERIRFVGLLPLAEYFDLYTEIDISLDPFPYGGGTTTCDSLWMGVPVISLRGETAVGRGGLSILSNVGLPELVARDIDEYIKLATDLARDSSRLAKLRQTIRPQMQRSPLMDAPRFAKNVEAAYRQMWQQYCDSNR